MTGSFDTAAGHYLLLLYIVVVSAMTFLEAKTNSFNLKVINFLFFTIMTHIPTFENKWRENGIILN